MIRNSELLSRVLKMGCVELTLGPQAKARCGWAGAPRRAAGRSAVPELTGEAADRQERKRAVPWGTALHDTVGLNA